MTALSFQPVTPPSALPEAWGALERALYRWLRQCGAAHETASIAAWVSFAESEGHTALSLSDAGLPDFPAPDAAALHALRHDTGFVSDGSADPTALVMGDDEQVMLWRNFRHEAVLSDAVIARLVKSSAHTSVASESDLDALFHGSRSAEEAAQRRAVADVLGNRLFVLTGGPGTGKTTTVLRMLMMLQRNTDNPLTVRVAAPTGKAAQRLRQSLRDGRQRLLLGDEVRGFAPLSEDWQSALACIPDGEALTLHRLLGYAPHSESFSHTADNPIAADVVVVDEASMVDLRMMRGLFEALRPETVLILVGDADQLTSVASGSVLMDIVGALEGRGPLVRLHHSFRAEPALQEINASICEGNLPRLEAALAGAGDQATRHEVADAAAMNRRVDQWAKRLAALGLNAGAGAESALQALRILGGQQVLCALRRDAFGAMAVNARIEMRLKNAWEVAPDQVWYAGRAVLITRNDYESGLFNGDVGLCLPDEGGEFRVWFETALDDGSVGVKSFAPGMLPAHEGAFAVTIHKSQGSEYAHVAVLLPPDTENRILSRQLLYTGVSRAKKKVEIWSSLPALEAAMSTPVRRMGGLAARLGKGIPS